MIELRDYQHKASLNTRRALKDYRRVVLESPTGSGKTIIAGDICSKASKGDYKPVFLTDRIEIAERTLETFRDQFGLNTQLISSSVNTIWKADAYISMAETFYRKCLKARFPKSVVKLLFCDEAHMKVFNKIINLFPHAYVIGLTATPTSNSFNMNEVYDGIVHGESTSELIRRGYLCRAVEFGHAEYIQMKASGGKTEFTTKDQREAFSQYNLDGKGIETWLRTSKDRSTLVYNIDIEHNNQVAEKFRKMGVSCAEVTSKTDDDERRRIFNDYKDGKLQVVCNVDVATKGFDAPITGCILFNKITKSINVWRQAGGRGARLYPGKEYFTIIDIGNNVDRHGSFNEDVDWSYMFHNPQLANKNTNKPCRHLCPTCYQYITNIHLSYCSVCENPISIRALVKLEDHMPEELKEKDVRDMTFKELQIFGKFKGRKPGWAWFQYQSNTRKSWQERRRW